MILRTGPRATHVSAPGPAAWSSSSKTVTVSFSGGSAPFSLHGTRNCTTCCDSTKNGGHTVDFDASSDGVHFVNGTSVRLADGATITFKVGGLAAPPSVVRHTAASIWPQCALYNQEGLPLFPFEMRVSLIDEQQQVSAKSDDVLLPVQRHVGRWDKPPTMTPGNGNVIDGPLIGNGDAGAALASSGASTLDFWLGKGDFWADAVDYHWGYVYMHLAVK